MTPERECGPVSAEPQEKQPPESWSSHFSPTSIAAQCGIAVKRVRNRLARWISTSDQVFSRDMSLVIDRQIVEIERLREQLSARSES